MHQLIQSLKDGHLELAEIPLPHCGSGAMLVRSVNSLISIGTEKSLIELARRSLLGKAQARPDLVKRVIEKAQKEGYLKVYQEVMNRLDEPFPLGYSASGIVVEVGSSIDEFAPGDRVAEAGSGFANHAEYNCIPRNLAVKIPEKLSFEEAAFCMVGGIALQGIREGEVTFGERVAVIGLGLIGLLTVQILSAVGCHPLGIDIDEYKINMAKELGCPTCIDSKEVDPIAFIQERTGGIGADCVLITAAAKDNAPVELAQKLARQRGRIVLVGVSEIKLDRKYFFDKELSFRVSRGAGPGLLDEDYELRGIEYPIGHIRWPERDNIEYFLNLVAAAKVNVSKIITHRYPFNEAVSAYDALLSGKERSLGVLFTYPEATGDFDRSKLSIVKKSDLPDARKDRFTVSFIGGGMFTKNILLPALKEIKNVTLAGVATTKGMTAEHLASKFGFSYCTSEYKKILNDEATGSVFITTRHNLHAPMVIEALQAGKNVFVEKPLCLTEEELEAIIAAYNAAPENVQLMVGFNRRHSPFAQDIRKFLAPSQEPLVITCRINAGFIEPSHWVHDPLVGGGRIIGEVCHFVDFLQYITGATPINVYTEGISGSKNFSADDNIVSTLKFSDGSVATITYSAKGTKAWPRELFEIYQNDSVYMLEDFRSAVKVRSGKKEKKKLAAQDMGYKGELEYFFGGNVTREDVEGYFTTMRTVFAMVESLKTGKPAQIIS